MFLKSPVMIKETSEKFDYLFKIVIIGDSSVGKSNIISRLVKNEFSQTTKPTIGVDFATKTFTFDKEQVKIQLWDTAGQERYHAIVSAYYRGSSGAIIVYDVTNQKSFENIRTIWMKNLRNVCDENLPLMILGNKNDLEKDRAVSKLSGDELAMSEKLAFFETSALSGDNINSAFEIFTRKIYDREKKKELENGKKTLDSNNLKSKEIISEKKKKSSCC
jgi:Ras-related protein Rab-11A